MGFSSSLGSAAVGLLGSAGSTAMGMYASSKAVRRQIEWEKEKAQNAHQWEVEDLRNAGLNPILSAGGTGAVAGSVSAPVIAGDVGRDINSARQTKINEDAVRSQTALNEATSASALATADRTRAAISNERAVADAQVKELLTRAENNTVNSARSANLFKLERDPKFGIGYTTKELKGMEGLVRGAIGYIHDKQSGFSSKSVPKKRGFVPYSGGTD